MSVEEQLKELILKNYKSIRAFAIENDLPYSTVDNVFKRGISGLGVSTASKMCKALGITVDSLVKGNFEPAISIAPMLPDDEHIKKYRSLPDEDKETVNILIDGLTMKNKSANKQDGIA